MMVFHSKKGIHRVYAVFLVIAVLSMVAFLGTGKPDSITGFGLYSEGNECVTTLISYDISCASPLKDILAVCKTTILIHACGSSPACLDTALEQCSDPALVGLTE